jgi:hypothetical protein
VIVGFGKTTLRTPAKSLMFPVFQEKRVKKGVKSLKRKVVPFVPRYIVYI